MTPPFLLALAASALAFAARAQPPAQLDARTIDSWRRVELGNGVAVDVPTAVGEAYRPANKQDAGLMLFRVSVKDAGEMYCALDRLAYNAPPLGMARARAIDFFSNANMAIFCHGVGTGVRESSAESVKNVQGYPGSRCVASYTDKPGDQGEGDRGEGDRGEGGKTEGDVIHARAVVGEDALYVLTCTVRDLDQARAETDWETIWRPRIGHIEDSLKLP